ncbi:MAG: arginine repressor [Clostridia bacterium]|nr:arginine repressor [Clostridia bacterium]
MKVNRQTRIKEIITEKPIETQEELLALLIAEGYPATQSTVSRDIRELKIVKNLTHDGKYRYSLPKVDSQKGEHIYSSALTTSVISAESAQNLVVIKTFPGMASSVALAIDNLRDYYILGCVAGDDTVMVVARTPEAATSFAGRIRKNFS